MLIKTKLKTSSAEFKAAAESMRAQVGELDARLALVPPGRGRCRAQETPGARKTVAARAGERVARPGYSLSV
jgi:aconitase B